MPLSTRQTDKVMLSFEGPWPRLHLFPLRGETLLLRALCSAGIYESLAACSASFWR